MKSKGQKKLDTKYQFLSESQKREQNILNKKRNRNNYNDLNDEYLDKFSDKDFVNNSRYNDEINIQKHKALDESQITTQSEQVRYQAFSQHITPSNMIQATIYHIRHQGINVYDPFEKDKYYSDDFLNNQRHINHKVEEELEEFKVEIAEKVLQNDTKDFKFPRIKKDREYINQSNILDNSQSMYNDLHQQAKKNDDSIELESLESRRRAGISARQNMNQNMKKNYKQPSQFTDRSINSLVNNNIEKDSFNYQKNQKKTDMKNDDQIHYATSKSQQKFTPLYQQSTNKVNIKSGTIRPAEIQTSQFYQTQKFQPLKNESDEIKYQKLEKGKKLIQDNRLKTPNNICTGFQSPSSYQNNYLQSYGVKAAQISHSRMLQEDQKKQNQQSINQFQRNK